MLESGEEKIPILRFHHEVAGIQPVAFRNDRRVVGLSGITAKAFHQSVFHLININGRNLHQSRPRLDGGQQLFRVLGDEDKNGLLGRFFKEFQQFVGRVGAHFLRHPDDGDFVFALVGLHVEFAQQRGRVAYRHIALLVLHVKETIPTRSIDIPLILNDILAPFLHKQVRFGVAFYLFCGSCRHNEMQVRMYQFLHLLASWAHAATVGFSAIWAKDMLGVGQGQRQFPASGRTQKELGVRNVIVPHTGDEALFYC